MCCRRCPRLAHPDDVLVTVTRSALRAKVRAIDAAKRAWGDKDEWKSTLKALADEGKLEFIEDNDMITFDVPELQ